MKLSHYLELKGLTDAAFAALAKCDRTTVMRWRRGKTRPTPSQIVSIENLTDGAVTPNDWFESIAAE